MKEMTKEQRNQLSKKQSLQATPTLGDLMAEKLKNNEEA